MTPLLGVGAVARRLGIATPTLRTWERRYGLGPSARTDGGHRRYTDADIERLASMHALVTAGHSPAQAAARVLQGDAGNGIPPREPVEPPKAASRRMLRGMLRAARDLDGARLAEAMRECVQERGLVECWTQLLVPLMRELGDSWERREIGVASEHLAAVCAMGVLASRSPSDIARDAGRRPVLLACADGEAHSLPLFALHAGLVDHGLVCQVLGAAVPRISLAGAVRRTGPAVVFLWSSLSSTGGAENFRCVPAIRKPVEVVLGGPGWDRGAALADPRRVHLVDELQDAVDLIARLVGNQT